jgi:serine/threonine protein kinase
MPFQAGDRLGPYEILGFIGAGGMGEVYQSRDSRLNRTVALKILPAERVANPERRSRFLQEAQLAAALHHPNIVRNWISSPTSGCRSRPTTATCCSRGPTREERIFCWSTSFNNGVRHVASKF